jgi:hypothetical protein
MFLYTRIEPMAERERILYSEQSATYGGAQHETAGSGRRELRGEEEVGVGGRGVEEDIGMTSKRGRGRTGCGCKEATVWRHGG